MVLSHHDMSQVLPMDCEFGAGCGSLLHLACALPNPKFVGTLLTRSKPNIKIWSNIKDSEGKSPIARPVGQRDLMVCPVGHIPKEVCMKPEVRRMLPPNTLLPQRNVLTVSSGHTQEDKRMIFEMASRPERFYSLIKMLNVRPHCSVHRLQYYVY